MMRKHKDWRARLAASVEAQRRLPFEPGKHDCALFAANCIQAMTDVDLAEGYRGKYSTVAGAVRALRKAGYNDLSELGTKHFQELEGPVYAVSGDIAIISSDDFIGWNVGIVNGERVFVLREDGVGTVSRALITRAFRVPT